jgi:hypothetical protein
MFSPMTTGNRFATQQPVALGSRLRSERDDRTNTIREVEEGRHDHVRRDVERPSPRRESRR